MEIYDFISMDILKKNSGKNGSTYRQLVYKQHHMCLEYLKDELIVNKRISKEAIVKERYELCVCKVKMHHNTMTLHVMPCCAAKFNMTCIGIPVVIIIIVSVLRFG